MQHYKFIHGIIANKELYGNQVVPVEEIACDQCDLVFKYKKNLNVHKKRNIPKNLNQISNVMSVEKSSN